VNGVDHHPWFEPDTFSARALAANRFPVIHAYPWWAEALKYGGPMDPPSTKIWPSLLPWFGRTRVMLKSQCGLGVQHMHRGLGEKQQRSG